MLLFSPLTLNCTVELILPLEFWTTYVSTPWVMLPWTNQAIKQLGLQDIWLPKGVLVCKHVKRGGHLIQSEEYLVTSKPNSGKTQSIGIWEDKIRNLAAEARQWSSSGDSSKRCCGHWRLRATTWVDN